MTKIITLLLAVTLILCSCGSKGVSQEKYDQAIEALAAARKERDALKEQFSKSDKQKAGQLIVNAPPTQEDPTTDEISRLVELYKAEAERDYYAFNRVLESLPIDETTIGKVKETYDYYINSLDSVIDMIAYVDLNDKDPEINHSEISKSTINDMHEVWLKAIEEYYNGLQKAFVDIKQTSKTTTNESIESENLADSGLSKNNNSKDIEEQPIDSSSLTLSQENAIKTAREYLKYIPYSRLGLIEQLSSEYGSNFPEDDAVIAVDYLETHGEVDWNEQAAKAAKDYLEYISYSREGLIEQLTSEYGSRFTQEQAEYGVKAVGY